MAINADCIAEVSMLHEPYVLPGFVDEGVAYSMCVSYTGHLNSRCTLKQII